MAMRVHHQLQMAWRNVVRRRAIERELDEELQFHMQQLAERYAAREAGAPHAQRDARRRFGGLDQIKEACRDMRTMHPLEDFLRDLRIGLRLLIRSPVFSIVAILSLAIGIGFNSAIFSLINAVMLRALPVPNPQQLQVAEVYNTQNNDANQRFGYPTFLDARDALKGQVMLAAATNPQNGLVATPQLASDSEPAQGMYQLVSGEYFSLLEQTPQIGRLLGPQDNVTLGDHAVAVISDGFWTRKFQRSPAAIGSELRLNNTSLTIIGVTQPQFFGTTVGARTPDLWAPVMMQTAVKHFNNASTSNPGNNRRPWPPQRNIAWLTVFSRITQPGQEARVAEALNIGRRADLLERRGTDNASTGDERFFRQTGVRLTPAARGLSTLRDDMSEPLVILLVMVGLLLLIACANIASLLIARSASRAREMAIRLSIGAGRLRLVRQLLAESLLLAICGGALGLFVASWGSSTLLMLASRSTRTPDLDLSLNWRVIGFTLAVSMAAGLLFGLLPALRSTRVSLSETLRAQSRATVGEASTSRHGLPFGKLLVAAQMAVCLLLLVVAGLFARTLQQVTQVNLGLDKDHVIAARVSLRAGGYTEAQLPALYDRIVQRLSNIPGVTSASVSLSGPLAGGWRSSSVGAEGYQAAENEGPEARVELVSSKNLQTFGIPLVEGRYFADGDFAPNRRVSIINETMAKKYFKGQAIGKRWSYDSDFAANEAYEVVGVVKDARYNDLRGAIPNMVFMPTSTEPEAYLNSIEMRTTRPTASAIADMRAALREIEPNMPIVDIQPVSERIARMTGTEQFIAYLTGAFGVVALLLASLGLYGTISYGVSRRTSELGVRVALGASRGHVLWLVLREALMLVAIGLAVGVPLTYFAATGVEKTLYGVKATDLFTASGSVLVLILVAAMAAFIPARRASRVDPMLALRGE